MLRKFSLILLSYIMIIAFSITTVKASNTKDFSYYVNDGQAVITGYQGTDTNIVIPEEIDGLPVTEIGTLFCYNIDVVESLVIPETITAISNGLISNPVNEIIVEGNQFVIRDGILYNADSTAMIKCTSDVSNLTIPDTVVSIENYCLSGTQITSLTVPETVNYLGNVENVPQLKDINVNGPIQSFNVSKCPMLETVSLPATVNYISDYLEQCNSLREITIDDNNPSFESVDGVVYWGNTLYIYPSAKQDSIYSVKEGTVSVSFRAIDNPYLQELIVSKDVSHIAYEFLRGCTALNKITVDPENTNFSFENDILYKGNTLIYPITEEKKVVVKEGTETIGVSAFADKKGIEEIILPDSLMSINDMAFANCQDLKTINIPKNISYLSESEYSDEYQVFMTTMHVFTGCNALENITVDPENQHYVVENGALYTADYSMLVKYFDHSQENFTVNENTKYINYMAFENVEPLKTLDLKNVTDLVYLTFYNCSNLESVTFNHVDNIDTGYTFYSCDALNNVKLPDSLKQVNVSGPIFYNCQSLTNIDLNQITNFKDNMISQCPAVKKLVLPRTIESVQFRKNASYQYYVYADSSVKTMIDDINQRIASGTYDYDIQNIDYQIVQELADESTQIVVDTKANDNIDENTVLAVEYIGEEHDDFDFVNGSIDNFEIYDITLTNDGENVQLDEAVEVKIPVSDQMVNEKCKVYHLSDDDEYTDMNAVYENGYMVFQTNHFSKYIITDEEIRIKSGDVNSDGSINYMDAIQVLQQEAKLISLSDTKQSRCDANHDGVINYLDALKILRYEAGLIDEI